MADIVLKILSGPHLGAEAALKDGVDYVLGSGQDSDLTLADTAMAEKHFSVRVDQDKISLKPMGGQVLQDGLVMPPGESGVDFYTLLKAGNTRFSLGEEGGPWPDPVKLESRKEPSPFLIPDSDPATSPEGGVHHSAPAWNIPAWLDGHKQTALIVLIVFILAVMAVVAFQRLERPLTGFEQRQLSLSLLKRGGFATLLTDINKDGVIVISGRIGSRDRLHKLQRIFSGVGYPVRLEIMLTETVAFRIRSWLQQHSIPLRVSVSGAGELIISGYARTLEAYDAMLRRLREAVPCMGHIESRIITYKQVVPELASLLGSEGLWDKVSLRSDDFELAGTVELRPGNKKDWALLVARIDNIFEISIPFDVNVITPEETYKNFDELKEEESTDSGGDTPPADRESWETVQSVLIDQSPSAYIDDSNQVYSVGDLTPSGYLVTEVTRMGVVLMRGNDMLFLPTKEF